MYVEVRYNNVLYIQGADRTTVRKVLVLFSLAAPVMSLFTYFALSTVCMGL